MEEHSDVWWDNFFRGKKDGIEWAESRSIEEIKAKIEEKEREMQEYLLIKNNAWDNGFLAGLKDELEAREKGWVRRR